MMRPIAPALLIAACALAACQTSPPPAAPPVPAVQPPPAPPTGEAQDPNLKAQPTAPIGRQSLPPPAPR